MKATNTLFLILLFILFPINTFSNNYLLKNNKEGNAQLSNHGTLRLIKAGDIIGMPDTIGGRVEFVMKEKNRSQIIPNVTYHTLLINSNSWMRVDSLWTASAKSRPLSTLDSLIILSDSQRMRLEEVEIHAKGTVINRSKIGGSRDVRANKETSSQDVGGGGKFSRFNVDNPHGVDIVDGGITIENQLTLTRGALRSTSKDKVTIGNKDLDRLGEQIIDSTEIAKIDESNLNRPRVVRSSGTSVEGALDYVENSDLHYRGAGSIVTTDEVPDAKETIQNLRVENTDSLVLAKNLTANDTLFVATHVHAYDKDTLTLTSTTNPIYDVDNNPQSEIQGHFRRTDWKEGDTIVLNNAYTYLLFKNPINRDDISTLVSTIFPRRYHNLNEGNVLKVKRAMTLSAQDANSSEFTGDIDAEFGYGWRYGGDYDEVGNLAFERLVLKFYDAGAWVVNSTSSKPIAAGANNWAYANAMKITSFGDYSIGSQIENLIFAMKTRLEGAVRDRRTGMMGNDLQRRNLLTMPPPDIYPYNLDPKRPFYVRTDGQLPDSVVDWVVVEFRENYTDEPKFNTLLLKTDGSIVDLYGNKNFLMSNSGDVISAGIDFPTDTSKGLISDRSFYFAVRHRNHAAVISNEPVKLQVNIINNLDFTSPSFVMGGTNSLRKVAKDPENNMFLYGLLAGDVNNNNAPNGEITDKDYNSILPEYSTWKNSLFEGYLLHDLNLDGIITTLDFNIGFNNRNRIVIFPY
ncbi:MAG: hypothetical protein GX372_07715 [Ignavibacteria bacterium]|jgi:hypothetical protein|nr:hypothetical protein [Ignavibacteria bacterium]